MVYRASALRGLAIAQMVFGAFMVVFGVACIFSVDNWTSYVGFGIWVGVWVLIAGILGYVGAKDDSRPNQCLIGCFMGFSVTACVLAGTMFICYCIAVSEFANTIRCKRNQYRGYNSYSYYTYPYRVYYDYCYSSSTRYKAAVGAGLGSCQLIFAIVEFFVALASSIYCCNAVCCGAPAVGSVTANQQVVFLQPGQQIYPGGQGGVVVIQPSGAMTTVPQGYANMPGQPAMYVPQQPLSVQLPPAYSVQPAGASPAGMVAVSYAGSTMPTQTQVQGPPKDHERPPPYAFIHGGNAPPSAPASGAASAAGMPGVMEV